MTQRTGGGGSTTAVVGIIAVVVLAAFFAWVFVIRDRGGPEATAAPQTQTEADHDIEINVDLPDSVVIKP